VTDLLLVRHGESEWNAVGRWQGHADPPLSELGRRQAVHAAAHLEPLDLLVSSDLRRAAETADLIAEAWGIDGDVAREPRIRERAAGEWEGLTRVEIEAGWPGYLDSRRHPPGFEEDDSVLTRVLAALHDIAAMAGAAGASRVLVVSHGGVLRALDRMHAIDTGRIANLGGRWWHVDGVRPGAPPPGVDGALVPGGEVVLVDADEVTRPAET
jgi:probable phosphoglycerate mutase